MKIGLYGGTFNPIHNAHLKMAQIFIEQANLDKCYLIPSFISPFKINDDSALSISNLDRLNMIHLAIKGLGKIEILDYEINRSEISFTIDTISYLKKLFPNDEFFLLIGADQAVAFNRWKDWEKIAEYVKICIVDRPDVDSSEMRNEIARIFENCGNKPMFLNSPIINITSTLVRERIKLDEGIAELVPKAVASYIYDNNLYK